MMHQFRVQTLTWNIDWTWSLTICDPLPWPYPAQCIFGEHYISLILGVPNFPNFSIFPFQNQIISPNMMENELFYQIWGNRPLKAPGI